MEPSTNHHWQYRLRTILAASMIAVLAVLVLVRFGVVELPRHAVFGSVVLLITLPTLLWWAWVDEQLRRRRQPGSTTRRPRHRFRILCLVYTLGILTPVLLLSFGGWRRHDSLPSPLIMWSMAWHLMMILAGLVLLPIWPLGRLMLSLRRRLAPPSRQDLPDVPFDSPRLSRRAVLAGAVAAAPIVIAGGSMITGLRQQGRFLVRRVSLALPRLPDRLRGLTITHVSDMHVGRIFPPEHVPAVVEAANGLRSDLVLLTGDYIDHTVDFLPAACEAIAQLDHRYGRLLVIGNHDLIDSPERARTYLAGHEPGFLCDRHVRIDIGGETIQVAGLYWSRYAQPMFGQPGHAQRADWALAGADPNRFTIGLAHHPHAFDALADRGVDLTLAGHTHGGQLMLTSPGSAHPLGAGNLLFRYLHGEYRRGDRALFVNAGVGNWFPVRLNAPAEIVQIQLV